MLPGESDPLRAVHLSRHKWPDVSGPLVAPFKAGHECIREWSTQGGLLVTPLVTEGIGQLGFQIS